VTALDSAVLIDAPVLSPTNQSNSAVLVNLPVVGNAVCMLSRDTGSLGPGLAGLSFVTASQGYFPVVHGNRIYANATASGSATREGIWRICDGAPRALAASGLSGSLGPDTGVFDSVFTTIRTPPRPLAGDAVSFIAEMRNGSAAALQTGIFKNQSNSNAVLALSDTTGSLGPNFAGSTFPTFSFTSFASAGDYLVFENTAQTPVINIGGLWRVRADGGGPQPVVLEGQGMPYSTGAGQIVTRIDRWSMFANGDIVAECVVNGGPSGLYLFPLNRPAQLLLRVGQSLSVNTTSGPINATVTAFAVDLDSSQGAASSWGGVDSWAGSDGTLLARAQLDISGSSATTYISTQATDLNRVFRNGFE
jgi:hypothetical protein